MMPVHCKQDCDKKYKIN